MRPPLRKNACACSALIVGRDHQAASMRSDDEFRQVRPFVFQPANDLIWSRAADVDSLVEGLICAPPRPEAANEQLSLLADVRSWKSCHRAKLHVGGCSECESIDRPSPSLCDKIKADQDCVPVLFELSARRPQASSCANRSKWIAGPNAFCRHGRLHPFLAVTASCRGTATV